MAVVASSWLLAALFGSVPYMQQGLAPIDALFESMSGFTTTGSTVFAPEDFVRLSRGLIFWRSMTQWLGGLGIIVLFVAVLPALAVAGRRMFFAEAPGPEEEALTPRIRHTAAALWRLYIALTALNDVGHIAGTAEVVKQVAPKPSVRLSARALNFLAGLSSPSPGRMAI